MTSNEPTPQQTIDSKRRWRGDISYTALREACEYFDVALQISFRRMNGTRTRGTHRIRHDNNGPFHHLTISTYLTVEQANRTILHELAHASQAERVGIESFHPKYDSASRTHGYRNNPFEVEARAASEFSPDFRIAK